MRRPRLTYANVVSTICLFVLLGGSAWAASGGLAKNSVGTRQLKNGAVTGAKVKDGSLSGADIKVATLGTVPKAQSAETATSAGHATSAEDAAHAATATSAGHATNADSAPTAGDATTLDGLGSGAFFPAAGIGRIDAELVDEGPEQTLYSVDGLTLFGSCGSPAVPGALAFKLFAASMAPDARADAGFVEREGSSQQAVIDETELSSSERVVWATHATEGGSGGESVGSLVYTDSQRTIAFKLESRVASDGNCHVSGTATVSG